VAAQKVRDGRVDWRVVDEHRIAQLPRLLADLGLLITNGNDTAPNPSQTIAQPGSLFTFSQISHLARIWHRLPPWPDTARGVQLLNTRYTTATLSNTYQSLIQGTVTHGNLPFTHVLSSDIFDSYKPNPAVYLGAAKHLGVSAEECALVAAHLGDLKGAKACGFYAIYVERPLEEKQPELKDQDIPDLVVREAEDGFVRLAQMLGLVEDQDSSKA
jgi:2-haloacid dehalogenase